MKIRIAYEIDVDFELDGGVLSENTVGVALTTLEDSLDLETWGDQLVDGFTASTGFLVSGLSVGVTELEVVSH